MRSLMQDQPLGQSWAGWQPTCASVSRISGESLRFLPQGHSKGWASAAGLGIGELGEPEECGTPTEREKCELPRAWRGRSTGVIPVRCLGCPPKLPQVSPASRALSSHSVGSRDEGKQHED